MKPTASGPACRKNIKDHRPSSVRGLCGAHLVLVMSLLASAASAGPAQDSPSATEAPWTQLEKGLEVRDVVAGEGEEARRGQTVSVRYAGWLQDGTQFDSNRAGKELVFTLGGGRVIKGWDLGVVGMKPGGTRQLRIPAKLAYGKRGIPGRIPEDATLLFEIDLRSIF